MKLLKYIVTTMLLLMTLVVAGCGEDKWVGTWYDKTDNYISKSVITKEKNKDKTYNDAEWIMGYVEEQVDTGKTSNGTPIYNFRYNWTDKFVFNVQLTEKDSPCHTLHSASERILHPVIHSASICFFCKTSSIVSTASCSPKIDQRLNNSLDAV